MNYNKLKQRLESFLSPKLSQRVRYGANAYRFQPEKSNYCYLLVDNLEILNSKAGIESIQWFKTEQEVLTSAGLEVLVGSAEVEAVRRALGDKVPPERLLGIAKDRKERQVAKAIFKAQSDLFKTDFQAQAQFYMTEPLESSLYSEEILLNIWALTDRRLGSKRIQALAPLMREKHPVVRYVYEIIRA